MIEIATHSSTILNISETVFECQRYRYAASV